MKLQKFSLSLSLLCLMLLLFMPMTVFAGSGTTTLKTEVPATHAVQLEIQGEGSITADDKTYTESRTIDIERLKAQLYSFKADEGWQLKSVSYGMGDDIKEMPVEGDTFTAPELNKDGNTLRVVFEKKPAMPVNDNSSKTGDDAIPLLWAALMTFAAVAMWAIYRCKTRLK